MDILLTLLGLVVLVVGAELMIRGAVDLAVRARLSPMVIGLTVVSIGTSLPELLVSLIAAMKGSSEIAVGNVIGSNIANVSLVLGACIMIFPIVVERDAYRIHWPVMMISSLLFVGLLWDNVIMRWEGALLAVLKAAMAFHCLLDSGYCGLGPRCGLVRGRCSAHRGEVGREPAADRCYRGGLGYFLAGVGNIANGSPPQAERHLHRQPDR